MSVGGKREEGEEEEMGFEQGQVVKEQFREQTEEGEEKRRKKN